MSNMQAVEVVLRESFGASLGSGPLDAQADLLATGIIDSFGLIGLITSLEQTFGIQIAEEDVVPENFQSLERLEAFVAAKMLAGSPGSSADRHPAD
jgi:acyl carrier protein